MSDSDDPERDWERTQDALMAEGLGDGLPLVPPTPRRIAAMLGACPGDPDAVIATLAPMLGEATWRGLAREAVMAGCRPQYLPVVAAAVIAAAADEFNLLGLQTTTGSATTAVIVNGPIAAKVGMNGEGNALGPGNRANATIGRAVRLALQNIGGARPGETDMATLGQPGKFTFCLAENEAASPWPPLHVERGFGSDESVVTVFGASGIVEIVDSASVQPEDLVQTYAESMLIPGTAGARGLLGGGQPLLVMPPEHARIFAQAGWDKARLQGALFERAAMPVGRLSSALRAHITRLAAACGEPPADVIRVARVPADILVVVAGGVGIKAAYVPSWGGGTRAVSRRVG